MHRTSPLYHSTSSFSRTSLRFAKHSLRRNGKRDNNNNKTCSVPRSRCPSEIRAKYDVPRWRKGG